MIRYLQDLLTLFTRFSEFPSLLKNSFLHSFLSIFFTLLLCSLFFNLPRLWIEWPQQMELVRSISQQVQQHFPSDVQLTWQDQRLSTNLSQPLPIYYPQEIESSQRPSEVLALVLTQEMTQDTKLPSSPLFVITPTQVHFLANQTQLPLSDFLEPESSFTIDSSSLASWSNQVLELIASSESQLFWIQVGITQAWYILYRFFFFLTEGLLTFLLIRIFWLSLSAGVLWNMLARLFCVSLLLESISKIVYTAHTADLLSLTFLTLTSLTLLTHYSQLKKLETK